MQIHISISRGQLPLVFHSPLELDTDSFPCQVLQKWLRIHNELRLSWWNVGIYGLDGQGWKHKTANNKRLDYLHTILYKFILWWVQYVSSNSGGVKSVAGAVALKDFTPTFNFLEIFEQVMCQAIKSSSSSSKKEKINLTQWMIEDQRQQYLLYRGHKNPE